MLFRELLVLSREAHASELRARQFCSAALRNKLIGENVFIDVKASCQANKDRQFHGSRDVSLLVVNVAPDAEWQLLIALSRFGALRCGLVLLASKDIVLAAFASRSVERRTSTNRIMMLWKNLP
jgi:hypothetical protein